MWLVQSFENRDDILIHIPVEDGEALPQAKWKTFPVKDSSGLRNTSLLAGRDGRIWFADSRGDHGVRYFDSKEKPGTPQRPFRTAIRTIPCWKAGMEPSGPVGRARSFPLERRGPSIYLPHQLGLPVVPLYLFESAGGKIWVLTQFGRIYNVDTGSSQWQTYPQLAFSVRIRGWDHPMVFDAGQPGGQP